MLCGCDAMCLCDVVGCEVMLCGAKWSCAVVNWKMMCSAVNYGTPMSQYYNSVLQSTKKVLYTRYYKVLQSTTVLLTTK